MSRGGEPTLGFRLLAWIVIAGVRLLRWRVVTQGLEHVPRRGGAVITWHHTSHTDVLLTTWDIYRRLDRSVRCLALRELWDSKAFGWVPRLAGAVPVDRSSDGARDDALRDAVAALRRGSLVMVAPEGGISPSFEVAPMRTGAVRMAQAAGVPLIPSASWGTHRLSTTGHAFRPRRALGVPISIRFGEPFHVGPGDGVAEATEELRRRTRDLAHQLQDDYPDGAPAGAWWVPRRLGGTAPPLGHDRRVAPAPADAEGNERSADEGAPDRGAS